MTNLPPADQIDTSRKTAAPIPVPEAFLNDKNNWQWQQLRTNMSDAGRQRIIRDLATVRAGIVGAEPETDRGVTSAFCPGGGVTAEVHRAEPDHDPIRRRILIQNFPIAIEYPAGSTKLGEDDQGTKWARLYLLDYGFIEGGPLSTDGETMDVYLGPHHGADYVYVVNQLKKDGTLDEHKAMMGFASEAEATRGYLMHYPADWAETRVGGVKAMSLMEFRQWLKGPGVTKAASVKTAAALKDGTPLGEIEAIIGNFMAVLPAGTPTPRVRVVDSPTSSWLGICRFNYGEDNTTLELQRSILGDVPTLERIVAHELCHHAEFMDAAAFAKSRGWDAKTHARYDKTAHESHGPKFLAWAAKFNALYGADYVTKTSDAAMVVGEASKDIFVLLWKLSDGKIRFAYTIRPSALQKDYLKTKLAEPGFKYVVTRDATFAQGSAVGKAWSSTRDPGLNEKLEQLWNGGVAVPLPVDKTAALQAPTSPAFKAWFAGSKAVDAQGNPQVFYHGTSKDKHFDKFKEGMRGIWFTPSTDAASSYAQDNDSQNLKYNPETRRYDHLNESPRVIPVYLKMLNPYVMTPEEELQFQRASNYAGFQRDLGNRIRAKGYDSVIYPCGSYVVFNSNQVKSAIGNSGAYDSANPRITAATAQNPLPRGVAVGDDNYESKAYGAEACDQYAGLLKTDHDASVEQFFTERPGWRVFIQGLSERERKRFLRDLDWVRVHRGGSGSVTASECEPSALWGLPSELRIPEPEVASKQATVVADLHRDRNESLSSCSAVQGAFIGEGLGSAQVPRTPMGSDGAAALVLGAAHRVLPGLLGTAGSGSSHPEHVDTILHEVEAALPTHKKASLETLLGHCPTWRAASSSWTPEAQQQVRKQALLAVDNWLANA